MTGRLKKEKCFVRLSFGRKLAAYLCISSDGSPLDCGIMYLFVVVLCIFASMWLCGQGTLCFGADVVPCCSPLCTQVSLQRISCASLIFFLFFVLHSHVDEFASPPYYVISFILCIISGCDGNQQGSFLVTVFVIFETGLKENVLL